MNPNLALRWLTIHGILLLLLDGLFVGFIIARVCALYDASSFHPVIQWLR